MHPGSLRSRIGDSVATWQDVKTYIYRNYVVHEDRGHLLVLLLDMDGGRSQFVFVSGAPDSDLISISSPIGSVEVIDGNVLLSLSSNRVMGIRQTAGIYSVGAPLLLADLSATLMDTLIALIAEDADSYERDLGLGDRY